jgi:hypothetical protein
VLSKIREDFDAAGVVQSDGQILRVMNELTLQAGNQMPVTRGGAPDAVAVMLARQLKSRRARPPPPTSTEDRDPDDDPPRQSNRARQYPRNRNRRASSTLRDRAALPRSANVRSPLKDFQWWGSNCQGSIAIHRLHEPYVFLKGLVCDTSGQRASGDGGLPTFFCLRLSSLWHNCTLVYRAIWRVSRASPRRRQEAVRADSPRALPHAADRAVARLGMSE